MGGMGGGLPYPTIIWMGEEISATIYHSMLRDMSETVTSVIPSFF